MKSVGMFCDDIYSQHPGVVTRKIAGETLLVPVTYDVANMEKMFALNRVGEYIWERLNGERTIDAVIDDLTSDFVVVRERAQADCVAFVAILLEQGLAVEGKGDVSDPL